MVQADLVPVNIGNRKTFMGGMGNSIIDVTMVTTRFADRIKNWRVSNKNMLSDYNLLEFEVELEAPKKFQYIYTSKTAITISSVKTVKSNQPTWLSSS